MWKVIALGLVLSILCAGNAWRVAAHGREAARTELAAARVENEALRASIREQNRAVEAMAEAKAAAEVRGQAASNQAAANGRRLDAVLAGVSRDRATTCAEAMPTVNKILEGIR